MKRFAVALVMVAGLSMRAQAGVEIGGVAGLHTFSENNGLGTKDGDPIKQANSAMFAMRLGVTFGTLGIEAEGGLIPTESQGGNVTFDIYDVVARAGIIAQFRAADPTNVFVPFVSAGGGIMDVVKIGTEDSSLFNKETKPFGYVGAGVKYRAGGGWGVRVDARLQLAPGRNGKAVAPEAEVVAALYREWGRKKVAKITEPKKEEDTDADGIADASDKCPKEAEDKDGFQDDDGCPDNDNDGDGVADANDKCASDAEDKDNFQDDDGCPDPDNDSDGVADASDKCADQAETKNGFEDEDGCPDELPADLQKVLGVVATVSFKANSTDLAGASGKALDAIAAELAKYPTVKVEVAVHTDDQALKGGKFADNDALSQAQADAVKAYLVKKGVAEGQVTAKGYGSTKPVQDFTGLKGAKLAAARKANRRVEINLAAPEAAAGGETPAAPAGETKPAEGGEQPKLNE